MWFLALIGVQTTRSQESCAGSDCCDQDRCGSTAGNCRLALDDNSDLCAPAVVLENGALQCPSTSFAYCGVYVGADACSDCDAGTSGPCVFEVRNDESELVARRCDGFGDASALTCLNGATYCGSTTTTTTPESACVAQGDCCEGCPQDAAVGNCGIPIPGGDGYALCLFATANEPGGNPCPTGFEHCAVTTTTTTVTTTTTTTTITVVGPACEGSDCCDQDRCGSTAGNCRLALDDDSDLCAPERSCLAPSSCRGLWCWRSAHTRARRGWQASAS